MRVLAVICVLIVAKAVLAHELTLEKIGDTYTRAVNPQFEQHRRARAIPLGSAVGRTR